MAEGWKQIWDDLRNALRGEPKPEVETPAGVEAPPAEPSRAIESETIVAPPVEAMPLPEAAPVEAAAPMEDTLLASEPLAPEAIPALNVTPAPDTALEWQTNAAAPPIVERELTPHERWLERARTGAMYAGLAVLLLVGLWFAGGYRWWAQLTAPRPPASDVIATFDGGQITLADVEAHLTLLAPEESQSFLRSPELFVEMVDDMVSDELVRRWAATRQPDTSEDFSHTMQHITESLNLESLDRLRHEGNIQISESEIQNYYNTNKAQFGDQTLEQVREQIRQTLIAENEQGYVEGYIQRLKDNASITRNFELLDVPPPAEDDLRRYYDANLDTFKLERRAVVDELQFPAGADEPAARRNADDALLKIRSGASFGEVAQTITNTTLLTGTVTPEGLFDPAWDAAVFALTPGEVSDVFQAAGVFYIVRLNELQPARTQTLDEVRPLVLNAVQEQTTADWFEANGSKTLFTLKGKQFTLGQFYKEYQELPASVQTQYAGPEGMKTLAEQLIERLLLVEDTYDQLLDVQNKPLTDEARLQVLKQMLHQEEIDDKIEVTDAEIQKYYDENQALMALPPKLRIRYIRIGLGASADEQTAARARADEAYRKLVPGLFQPGADFATVAQEYSEDPETAAQGGEFPDWIGESADILAEAQLHPFHEAIMSIPVDGISPPFDFGDSIYIVQVIERTEPQTLALEEAKPYIEEYLNQQKHADLSQQLSDTLFKQANVVIYESVLLDYFNTLTTPAAPVQ